MKKGLSAFELKNIAVLAMVCDHIAWSFIDELSITGQIMHVIGRLTIPIMCFFIAEGLRHTGNLKKYIFRIGIWWIISAVPFYLFFGKMYGYRQNILFDLLTALLTAAVFGSEKLRTPIKVLLVIPILAVSILFGGWPLLPICFVLMFRFIKDRRKQNIVFVTVNTVFTAALCVLIFLNQSLRFAPYDWVWYEKIYLAGFSLALIPLWFYNGERGFSETKGKRLFGKYFFYAFYPAHLLILYFISLAVMG